jgi:hypothetical protein
MGWDVGLQWTALAIAIAVGLVSSVFGLKLYNYLLFFHGFMLFAVPTYVALDTKLAHTSLSLDGDSQAFRRSSHPDAVLIGVSLGLLGGIVVSHFHSYFRFLFSILFGLVSAIVILSFPYGTLTIHPHLYLLTPSDGFELGYHRCECVVPGHQLHDSHLRLLSCLQ